MKRLLRRHWMLSPLVLAFAFLLASASGAFAQNAPPPRPEMGPQPRPPIPGLNRGPGQMGPGQMRPAPGTLPPGHPPLPRPAPAHPVDDHSADSHDDGHHGADHCPGHGPMDPPHHINWWQGLVGVDNDKAVNGSSFDKLLWRYENKNDKCDKLNQPPPFLAVLINFGLFAFLLVRFAKKPLSDALKSRKKEIMEEIDAATELREAAEARLDEYEQKLEHVEDQLEELKETYAVQGQREKERVLKEAEETRARMRRDAEFRLEQEMKAAKEELLQESVVGAVSAAEELLAKRVTAADHERLAEEYLKSLAVALREEKSA